MEEIMLKLSEFRHNHHPSGVKMLAKFIRRGFSVHTYLNRDMKLNIKIVPLVVQKEDGRIIGINPGWDSDLEALFGLCPTLENTMK